MALTEFRKLFATIDNGPELLEAIEALVKEKESGLETDSGPRIDRTLRD